MSSPNPEAFLSVLFLEAITGLSSSLFTIICLSLTGTKGKRISTFNRILMALSASNICFILSISTNFLTLFVWPNLYKITYFMYIVYFLTMYSITSTSWLTSTLCLFYFLKIMPSQPGILAKLKNMTSTIIGGLLFAAEVVALGGSVLSILTLEQNSIQMNSTESGEEKPEAPIMGKVTFMDIVLALNGLPFFIAIVTTVVSASLLKLYNGQVKKNIRNSNANVKDYGTAVQTMTALLIFYLLTFLVMIVLSLNIIYDTAWDYWICGMCIFSFPTVQSALIIYGNPKLKEVLRNICIFIAQTLGSGHRDI